MKINVKPDIEKARSMLKMAENREETIELLKKTNFPTILVENYYEIVKELASAIFLLKGRTFIGTYAHKELISELETFNELDKGQIFLADNLRTLRNGSMYYGKQVEGEYIKNNEQKIKSLIKTLKEILKKLL